VIHFERIPTRGRNHIVEVHTHPDHTANFINKVRESIVSRTISLEDKDWIEPTNGHRIEQCVNSKEAEAIALNYMKQNQS
jgi:hypothetical protein